MFYISFLKGRNFGSTIFEGTCSDNKSPKQSEEEGGRKAAGNKGGSVFCHRRLHLGPSLSLSPPLSLSFTRLRKEVRKNGGRKADYHKRKSGIETEGE